MAFLRSAAIQMNLTREHVTSNELAHKAAIIMRLPAVRLDDLRHGGEINVNGIDIDGFACVKNLTMSSRLH